MCVAEGGRKGEGAVYLFDWTGIRGRKTKHTLSNFLKYARFFFPLLQILHTRHHFDMNQWFTSEKVIMATPFLFLHLFKFQALDQRSTISRCPDFKVEYNLWRKWKRNRKKCCEWTTTNPSTLPLRPPPWHCSTDYATSYISSHEKCSAVPLLLI